MVRKILEACPSCGGELEIGEVHCTNCETQIQARYRPCDFCMLTDEQSTFLRLFVLSRGNLTEVEKRLGVSYPTVRAKLDEVIERLEGSEGPQAPGAPATAVRRRAAASRIQEPPPSNPGTGAAPPPGAGDERRRLLEAVARGEVSAEEASSKLRTRGDDDEATD